MRVALTMALHVLPAAGMAQVFSTTPDWQSADQQVSTGAALVDLNRDGWLDLVVSNGNDISQQRVVVYYNDGTGALQTSPGWMSGDIGYHGHLDVADVDGDGWTDVAVAVLVNQGGPSAKLYKNQGGTLTAMPVWTAPIAAASFGLAFGDMNGDGRPDLAVASGWPYGSGTAYTNAVYLNAGGALSASPSWQTPETRNFGSAHWLDADGDGRLDLCYTGWNTYTYVYRNLGVALEPQPSYRTEDLAHPFALMSTSGDVTGDGVRDLLIADNNQVFSGTGRFRQYNGAATGMFAPTANWTFAAGSASAVALGDLNGDGSLDLCAGEWFGRARLFLNSGNGFGAAASWISAGNTTTIEKLVLGDVDRAGLQMAEAELPAGDGRRLRYLGHAPVESINWVAVDGVQLTRDQYTFSREHGWVSVGVTPSSQVRVGFTWSKSLDLAVANWDDNRPNQLYLNRSFCYANCDLSTAAPILNVNDYVCFLTRYAQGASSANCDGSTLPPVLNVNDFVCFQSRYAQGCL